MKIIAEKIPSGEYELYIEIPPVKLPVLYTEDDLAVLEKNGVLRNRDSYNAGSTIKFTPTMESQKSIETAILDAVTENTQDD